MEMEQRALEDKFYTGILPPDSKPGKGREHNCSRYA